MQRFLALLLVAFSTHLAAAQASPSIVNSPGSPLLIVSNTSTMNDFLSSLQLRNVSGRSVSSFQLGYLKLVAAGCGPAEVIAPEELFDPDRVEIASGAEFKTRSYGLSPSAIERFATENGAVDVQTQIAVVNVQFSDGGTWSFPRAGKAYDDAKMARNAFLRCSKTPKAVALRASAKARCSRSALFPSDGGDGPGYKCGNGTGESCQNAANGQSCTDTICETNSGPNNFCPDQTFVATISPVAPVPK
jgi:hypothetical protein